ncbi:MAG TPA: hypoxanthine phosphoribosyltransferase [Microthrixaceae bacterium]|jgi:hypoxanthine phosphoribosyltransferase|nr:hypoxanthine phosphoribosyltransferase [Microthrixaceae bacterium]
MLDDADDLQSQQRLTADDRIGKVLLTEEQLTHRIAEMGEQITEDYSGRRPLLVGVLRGAYAFLTDLAFAIDLPVEIDFIAVSSYGSSTRTSGVVRLVKDLDVDLTDRHVILVEDIVDTGLTLRYLRRSLEARGPASLEVCTLLARESADLEGLGVRYVGFTIPGDFVVGYGLDAAEKYRNLRYLAVYDPDHD